MLKHQVKKTLNYWNLGIFQETLEGHVSSVSRKLPPLRSEITAPQLGTSVLLLHHRHMHLWLKRLFILQEAVLDNLLSKEACAPSMCQNVD